MGKQPRAGGARLTALGSLFLCLALLALALPARGSLFPPGSDVVLLAGLPGDLESERLYRDQLQGWVDLVAASKQVERLFVLCDDPGAIVLPPVPETIVLKGDRAQFLALSQTLAGRTNDLLVLAWGHGGRQGTTPVFHVRGPRLTGSDFLTLATNAAAPRSRWVLMFRASGAFARQLAADDRQIISSEQDTLFTSDPIGMSVLRNLAQDQPNLVFDRLGDALGQGTAAWYHQRNLARTEEPTLWVGTRPPKSLVVDGEADTNRVVGATSPEREEQPTQALSTPKAPASPITHELPAAWAQVQPVEATDFPDTDGIVLRRQWRCTLGSPPTIETEQDEFIQVFTPEGKRFGDFDVAFSPPFEDVAFLDCEVLPPNGGLIRLVPDAIREAGEGNIGDYQKQRRKFFSLPGVVPGAIIHVRYRTQWKNYPLPHVSMQVPLSAELPILAASIQVDVPSGTPFHFALDDFPSLDPTIKQGTYGTSYTWELHRLPPTTRELLSAPFRRPQLLLSTFPDWQAFAEWYGRICKLTDEVSPEIQAKAEELTRQSRNDLEKVSALYNYVTRLRYVAVPLGVNSFRPHAAINVLHNGYGDCKDKANLLNALLHALNLEAHLVLVPRFGQAFEAIPGLAFNHAISRVTLGKETIWVDTTDDICRFGMLPPGDPGRNALVIDGQTKTLVPLPTPEPREHRLRVEVQLDGSLPGGAMPATLRATAKGYPDYALRETAREAKEHGTTLPLLNTSFRPVNGAFALERQSATPASALDEDFTWQAKGACVGLNPTAEGKCQLRPLFWIPKEWDLALNRRQMALFLNQGYPLTLEEESAFTLPEKAQPAALPGVQENSSEPLRWKMEWKPAGPGKLTARLRVELVRGELSERETPVAQQQMRALMNALGTCVMLDTGSVENSQPGPNHRKTP